jgi:DNA invertase Pin-like site-specific DNA recombinase
MPANSALRRRRRNAANIAPVGTAAAYIRVSTDEQATRRAGLDAQRAAITAEADRRGWTIADWYADEGLSGGKPVGARPQLAAALEAVESGAAAALMVAKSDRLSRSLRALLDVLDRAEHAGGVVVAVDGSIDTSTAAGRFTTQIMGGVAELERALISDRTKAALAEQRKKGVRLGRPSTLPAEVVERILTARTAGLSYPAIASALNADGVPTAHRGARWWPATVRQVEFGQDAARLLAIA